MLILKPAQWAKIKAQLVLDYPPSVMLIRSRMKQELGFIVREHSKWITTNTHGYYELQICLDFYNDAMESWFQLKYM